MLLYLVLDLWPHMWGRLLCLKFGKCFASEFYKKVVESCISGGKCGWLPVCSKKNWYVFEVVQSGSK
jgi:hypothetical protein